MENSQQKVAFITGASAGMGKDAALRLIKEGYTVYGAARRLNRMQEIVDAGGHVIELDVTDAEASAKAVEKIIHEQGRIDVLVNSAGYGSYGAVEDVPLEEAKRQFEVNVFGLAQITQQVLPYMRAQKAGKIVNISSIAGKVHVPMGAWYCASKHAVEALSDCLRFETRQFGIDVIIIQPGAIESEWGAIAQQSVKDVSGHTAYANLAKAYVKMEETYANNRSPPPSAVSDLLVEALEAEIPETRYIVGNGAAEVLSHRKNTEDREFDSFFYDLLDSVTKESQA